MSTTSRRVVFGLILSLALLFGAPAVRSEEPEGEEPAPAVKTAAVPILADAVKDLPKDPLAARDLVKARLGFRPYTGFVKGWRGAWWDGTANSADAAELVMETLRRMRLPGVLARRKLSAEEAAKLLSRVAGEVEFLPEVQAALEGEEVSTGLKGPEVVAAVTDHWYVRSVKDGKWIALDPFFDDAGDPVAARPRPEIVRHHDRRRLRIEVFTRIEGKRRDVSVLRFEKSVGELIGTRLTFLLQGINEKARDETPAPEVFRPVLFVHGKPTIGRIFSGIAKGAGAPGGGLGRVFGEPGVGKPGDGPKLSEVRVDYVLTGAGLAERKESRYLYLAGEDGIDRISDITGIAVVTGAPTRTVLEAKFKASEDVAASVTDVKLPNKGPISEEQQKGAERLFDATFCFLDSGAHALASATAELLPRLDAALGTISAYGDARVLGLTMDPRTGGLRTDLVFDTVRTWARAGVKKSAVEAHAGIRGRLHADVEGAVLGALRPEEEILTVSSVFTAAEEQGIPIIVLGAVNREKLDELALPARTRRVLGERIDAGRLALLPEKPVELSGKAVLAWYEFAPETGACTGVWEDGRHQGMTETAEENAKTALVTTFCQGYYASFNSTLVGYAKEVLWGLRNADFNWTQVHLTALGNAAKLSEKAMKKAAADLAGKVEELANVGAIFGKASALVLLATCMPVE